MKKGIAVVLSLLMLAMLAFPLGVLFYLSSLEQAKYQPQSESFTLKEMAYGTPKEVYSGDLYEQITLSGTVVSTRILYEELELEDPYALRLQVQAGQVLHEGDVIGYCNGKAVPAKTAGVLRSVNLGSQPYLELEDLGSLAILCRVDEAQRKVLRRSSLELTDAKGNHYRLEKLEDSTADMTALLTSQDAELRYGAELAELQLNTGRVYQNVLMVDRDCVFSTDGGQTYYVREVTREGYVLENRQVEPGYTLGDIVCISGVKAGIFCDSGYRAVAEGGV